MEHMAVYTTYEEEFEQTLAEFDVENVLSYILASENIYVPCELSIQYLSQEKMASYNLAYRDLNKPTDVISIECERPAEFDGISPVMLGDILLCPTVIAKEANELQKSYQYMLCRMIIHGIFHLLGYDHQIELDATIMEDKEENVLRKVVAEL